MSSNTRTGNGKSKSTIDVGVQTELQSMNYVPPRILSGMQLDESAYPNFFAKPHMVFLLVGVCFLVGYTSFSYSEGYDKDSFIHNSQKGLIVAFLALIYYGALYFPSSIMQRPHYSFWRMILAVTLCYLLVLIFVLFQNKQDLDMFFNKFFDQELGKPLPEKSYAYDCRIYTPENPHSKFANVRDALDIYISAHFFGWLFKMLIIRDWKFCMFLSIFFEFLEMTFQHWLPNFGECWWDHWILDVFGCNALGIYVGHLLIQKFQMKKMKWTRTSTVNKNIFGNFVEFLSQPQLDQINWHIFSSTKRFYSVLYYIVLVNLIDLSNFFNKFVLWIPSSHYLLAIRIFLWGFLSIIGTREYYEYISNNMFMRLGPFLFVSHLVIFVEYSILFKFTRGTNYFTEPFPDWIVYSWVAIFAFIIIVTAILLRRDIKRNFCPPEEEKEKFE